MNTYKIVSTYIEQRVTRGELAQSSADAIRMTLTKWVRYAGDDPHAWTEEQVAEWLNPKRLRAATRKMMLHRLRPFVRWMIAEGHMTHDPTARIARIQVPDGNPRDLGRDEVSRLLAVLPDERAILIVLLMLHCALRCSDVSRIRIEDIDARRHLLHVRAKGGRGEATHWVPMSDEAWTATARMIRRLGRTSGPLIESYLDPGVALQGHTISRKLREWFAEAGLKEFPHDGRSAHALRHTCAQEMIDDGASLREVQFGLGHRTIRSTEIYVRREPPGLKEAMTSRTYLGRAA